MVLVFEYSKASISMKSTGIVISPQKDQATPKKAPNIPRDTMISKEVQSAVTQQASSWSRSYREVAMGLKKARLARREK